MDNKEFQKLVLVALGLMLSLLAEGLPNLSEGSRARAREAADKLIYR